MPIYQWWSTDKIAKCDEAKPVCKKCSIHFSNIKACDYGSNPAVNKKPSLKMVGTSPLKNDILPRSRHRCTPALTKASGATRASANIETLFAITPYQCSTLHGKIDPFSVLPEASSPRVDFLMYHCIATLALSPVPRLTVNQGLTHSPSFRQKYVLSSYRDLGTH